MGNRNRDAIIKYVVLSLLFIVLGFTVTRCQSRIPKQVTVDSKCFGEHKEWAYVTSPHIIISLVDTKDPFLPENGLIKGQTAYVFSGFQYMRVKIYVVKNALKVNKNIPEWISDIGSVTRSFIDETFGGIENILEIVHLAEPFDCTEIHPQKSHEDAVELEV